MFVGEDRRAAVDSILTVYDEVRTDSLSRLVRINGRLGFGKTRLIQEVYAALSARQEPNAANEKYWPPQIDTGFEGSARLRRKIVRPLSFSAGSTAKMPWMWWGVSCETREGGTAAQVLADDITQLQAHLAELLFRKQVSRLRRSAALALLKSLVTDAVPLGATLDLVREMLPGIVTFGRGRGSGVREALRDVDDAQRESLVDDLSSLLQILDDAKLTTVMVIDDAQDADESLIGLLEGVLRAGHVGSLLCIAASRPVGGVTGQTPSRFAAWTTQLSQEHPDRCALVLDLESLEPTACLEIVTAMAPTMGDDTAVRIAERAGGNPLVLQGMLETPKMRRRIVSGQRFTLSDAEIAGLPNTYDDLMRDRWEVLPLETQEALCIAALQGSAFVQSLVQHSYAAVMPTTTFAVPQLLRNAEDPHRWVRSADPVYLFSEPYTYDIALSMTDRVLWSEEIRAVIETLLDCVIDLRDGEGWGSLGAPMQQSILELHVGLANRALNTSPPTRVNLAEAGWSGYLSVTPLVNQGAPQAALERAELARRWLAESDASPRAILAARNIYAARLAAVGEAEAAAAELQSLTDELERIGAPLDDILAVRHNLIALAENASVELAHEILARTADTLGAAAPDTTTARQTYARALYRHQRFRAARAEGALVVKAREAEDPPDLRRILQARCEAAGYVASADASDRERRTSRDALAAVIAEAGVSLDRNDPLLRDARLLLEQLNSLDPER